MGSGCGSASLAVPSVCGPVLITHEPEKKRRMNRFSLFLSIGGGEGSSCWIGRRSSGSSDLSGLWWCWSEVEHVCSCAQTDDRLNPDGNFKQNSFIWSSEISPGFPEIRWLVGGHKQYQNCKNQPIKCCLGPSRAGGSWSRHTLGLLLLKTALQHSSLRRFWRTEPSSDARPRISRRPWWGRGERKHTTFDTWTDRWRRYCLSHLWMLLTNTPEASPFLWFRWSNVHGALGFNTGSES